MKTSILQLTVAGFLAVVLANAPLQSLAQNTNKPPTEKKSGGHTNETTHAEKSTKGGPFHGKLVAIDKFAKTITVGKRTFEIASETKIKKNGKPATLEDGIVGETVSGYIKPAADGKLIATSVNFGPKPAADSSDKSKATQDKEKQPK